MTELTSTKQKAGLVFLWLVTLAVAVPMLLAGGTKFQPDGMWPDLFAGWSYSMGFLYLIGSLEVLGALALLVPRLAAYAAVVLWVVMAGAAYTLLTHPGEMGPTPAFVNLVLLSIIAVVRWPRRWRPA
jgi:uncharacterized membrane protein YphA (DoxX/SURF4 family)